MHPEVGAGRPISQMGTLSLWALGPKSGAPGVSVALAGPAGHHTLPVRLGVGVAAGAQRGVTIPMFLKQRGHIRIQKEQSPELTINSQ